MALTAFEQEFGMGLGALAVVESWAQVSVYETIWILPNCCFFY
jgi:hypothetical protein